MMKLFPIKYMLLFAFVSGPVLFAQEQPPAENASIENQFEQIVKEASNYKNYEVIRQDLVYALRDSVLARINGLEEGIGKSQHSIDSLKSELLSLNDSISAVKAKLKTANTEKKSIPFLGFSTEKSTYRTIMWAVTAALAILLVVFVSKFKKSNSQTKLAKQNQEQTEREFEEFRQKALEKQQEMGRKLQDERNKRNKMDG